MPNAEWYYERNECNLTTFCAEWYTHSQCSMISGPEWTQSGQIMTYRGNGISDKCSHLHMHMRIYMFISIVDIFHNEKCRH